ncbi:hypothetical protein EMIHUDRAFT_218678 [Emiliania huxleyi CCMP1516]|uniref:AP2/ERF domain-containing protein n=2 Tax=Emiliania huxleyi TaxID=2903 RepID=A0A0D3I6S2_EMIH1|nr:hypothetical protein EMIHUDRAFT_218678 [Emiliania huxleyi CCMP1516]EOD06957.1 hypothetical protein EMIHUDRAFT_218678 [Emiliania huxleyi CCMP1516]|eukprot:XP_005759386.1 hypothetical protein EMIHUDRAFT_218678 [Emiliania huxleyi CCMP1516]
MAPARANSPRATVSERLVLIPAVIKNSTTGYKCVTFHRGNKKFQAKVKAGGKHVFLGSFDTVEEAATAYARSEYGRADAAKLRQPRAAPTVAGAEAIRQAEREGLTLATSSNNSTGYKGVTFCPKQRSSKKYKLSVWVDGRNVTLAVQQAGREGLTLATSSSSNSSYRGVTFYPKERRSKKYHLHMRVGGKQNFLGRFATAEEAALARARHLWDTTVRLLEPQPQQAPPQGTAGPSEASSYEEEDGFDPADIADAARLQPRDPNGWGATRCCKSLFHYRCLHTWLNDDSEVETSCGMEPINTACPGCRGFVSKSASRMLA